MYLHQHMMVMQCTVLSMCIHQMTNQHYIMYSVICLDPISCYRVYSLTKVHAVLYIVCICPFHVCIHAIYSVHSSELTSETHYLCITSHDIQHSIPMIATTSSPMMATISSQFPSVKLVYCLCSVHTVLSKIFMNFTNDLGFAKFYPRIFHCCKMAAVTVYVLGPSEII